MITIVAPIAMTAKKLASVSVCTRVFGFQKLFTSRPVRRSKCEPASAMSVIVSSVTTITSPVSCDARSRRKKDGPRDGARSAVSSAMGEEIRARRQEGLPEARVRFGVLEMRLRIGALERRARERRSHGGREVGERTRAHGGQQCGAIGGPLLAIDRRDGQSEDLALQTTEQRALGATTGQQHVAGSQPERLEDRDGIAEREADSLEHRAREMRTGVREAQAEERPTRRRVPMRGALALQVRQERHAPGTSWHGRRLGVEPCGGVSCARELAGELVAI